MRPPHASARARRAAAALVAVLLAGTGVSATSPAAVRAAGARASAGAAQVRQAVTRLVVQPGASTTVRVPQRGRAAALEFTVPPSYGDQLDVGVLLLSRDGRRTGYVVGTRIAHDGRVTGTVALGGSRGRALKARALPLVVRPGSVVRLQARTTSGRRPVLRLRAWTDGTPRPAWQLSVRAPRLPVAPMASRIYARASLGADAPASVQVVLGSGPDSEPTPPTTPTTPPTETTPPGPPTPTTPPTETTPPGPPTPPTPPGPPGPPTDPGTPPTDPPTDPPATTDAWGPTGRSWTRSDLDSLGWYGIEQPAGLERIRIVDAEEPLGADRPPGLLVRAELQSGDPTASSGHRAELYGRQATPWSTPPANWPDPPGSTRWFTFSLLVPQGFPVATDSTWLTLTQFKGYRGGSPPIALEIKRSNLRLGGTRANSGTTFPTSDIGPIKFGEWTEITVGMRYSTDPAVGWVEVFRDDVVRVPRTSVSTMDTYGADNRTDPVYLKQGIYRSGAWTSTQVLFFSPMSVSTTSPYPG